MDFATFFHGTFAFCQYNLVGGGTLGKLLEIHVFHVFFGGYPRKTMRKPRENNGFLPPFFIENFGFFPIQFGRGRPRKIAGGS